MSVKYFVIPKRMKDFYSKRFLTFIRQRKKLKKDLFNTFYL